MNLELGSFNVTAEAKRVGIDNRVFQLRYRVTLLLFQSTQKLMPFNS